MGLFDKINEKMNKINESFKTAQEKHFGNMHEHKDEWETNKKQLASDEVEIEYPVIVTKDAGWFSAITYKYLDITKERAELDECLEDIARDIEDVLQEEVEETGAMPYIPTLAELQANKKVQRMLMEGSKIKMVTVKLDISSLQAEEDGWGDDEDDGDGDGEGEGEGGDSW